MVSEFSSPGGNCVFVSILRFELPCLEFQAFPDLGLLVFVAPKLNSHSFF